MKKIKVITDEEFGLEILEMENPRLRIGARGIVIKGNKIAIFNKKNKNEFKLPGGGVDDGENPDDAFLREVLEETGHTVKIIKTLGTIEEIKTHDNFKQISYVYVSEVIEDTGSLSLTQKELDEGGSLVWLEPNEALEKVKNSMENVIGSKYEDVYHSKFIIKRDQYILEEYLKLQK